MAFDMSEEKIEMVIKKGGVEVTILVPRSLAKDKDYQPILATTAKEAAQAIADLQDPRPDRRRSSERLAGSSNSAQIA